MLSSDRVLMAEIGAAHGIRGEVRVKPYGLDPMALADYGPLETDDGRTFEIEALRPQKHMLIVRFKGIRDRNAAEALTRTKLYVAREKLPAPDDEDDFYHADLIGLPVFDTQGEELGTVVSVPNFGAGDLLEIAPKGARSFYLPFTREAVPEIDIAAGRLIAILPEGLLASADDEEERRKEEG